MHGIVGGSRTLEESLGRLTGVRAARVVLGPSRDPLAPSEEDVPLEVHVIADGTKAAKQLVRDVQSIALAGHGLTLDHRIISVVTLPDGAGPVLNLTDGAGLSSRPRLGAVGVHTSTERTTVDVVIRLGRDEHAGAAFGPASPRLRGRLVAEATLHALAHLHLAGDRLILEGVDLVGLAHRRVAVVSVVLTYPGAESLLIGSSEAPPGDEDAAVVRAVLDATNRRLPHLFPAPGHA